MYRYTEQKIFQLQKKFKMYVPNKEFNLIHETFVFKIHFKISPEIKLVT